MNLERFREVADEKTNEVRMTSELHAKILASMAGKRPARHRGALWVAAACLMVMALSAGVLAVRGDWFAADKPPQRAESTSGLSQVSGDESDVKMARTLSEWQWTSDAVLTPKQGENGLWGYVDENDEWVLEPEFAQAGEVNGVSAKVVDTEGNEFLLVFY